MSLPLAIVLLVLMGLLALVSYVDHLYAEMGKFLAREFEETSRPTRSGSNLGCT